MPASDVPPFPLKKKRSPIHRYGVFAEADIPATAPIMRYTGEKISHEEADIRGEAYDAEGITYLFILDDDWVIDGARGGSIVRFINHSCAPNVEAVIDEEAEEIWYEAIRDIRKGEELLVDYQMVSDEPNPCFCGAPNCRGTMNKDWEKEAREKEAKSGVEA